MWCYFYLYFIQHFKTFSAFGHEELEFAAGFFQQLLSKSNEDFSPSKVLLQWNTLKKTAVKW